MANTPAVKAQIRQRGRSKFERTVTIWVKVLLAVVLAAIVVSAILSFLGRVATATTIVIGAVFFTYAIYPIVRKLEARMPLGAALALVYVGILALIALGAVFLVPPLVDNSQDLAKSFPSIVANAQAFVGNPNNPITSRLPESARSYLTTLPQQFGAMAQHFGGEVAARTIAIVVSAVTVVATIVVIPVVSAYLIFEAPSLLEMVLRAVPPRNRRGARAIIADLDKALGGFIRGQFIIGAIVGSCITIALLVLHVRYAVLIGVGAGLLNVIPFVGAIVGFVPAVTLALFDQGWKHALIVAACFVAINQLEGHIIAPRVASESVGLSPLMVVVAILVGGELLGIAGMFLAVPIAAMIRVVCLHVFPPMPERPAPPAKVDA